MFRTVLSILTFCLAVSVSSGYAQATTVDIDVLSALERLEEDNDNRPWKNNNYARFSDKLGDQVFDETNHVIGSVHDIVLSNGGSIEKVEVNFGKLKVRSERLPVNFDKLGGEAIPGGYKFKFRDSELDEILPVLLNEINTASGDRAREFSAKKLLGAAVYSDEGKQVGTISDIVFDSLGRRAQYVLIKPKARLVSNDELAVPFSAVQYDVGKKGKAKGVISASLSNALPIYLDER